MKHWATVTHLQVYVTERPPHRRQQIPDRLWWARGIPELDLIVQRTVRTRWVVQESLRSSNGFVSGLTLLRGQHLPDPPHAINVGMVKVESRIARAGKDIVTRVTTESVVSAAVDADLGVRG